MTPRRGSPDLPTPPFEPTVRVDRPAHAPYDDAEYGDDGYGDEQPSGLSWAARLAVIACFLIVIGALTGTASYFLAGGRWGDDDAPTTPQATAVAVVPAVATLTSVPPTPAVAPTSTAPPAVTRQPTATSAPAAPTAVPAPPTAAPAPPTAAPPAAAKPPAPKPAEKPAADARRAEIDRRVRDYFAALNAGDFARAQQVCCTPAWRARYPLPEWERNFAGVTDLQLVGEPRYQSVEDDRVVVETDYTFISAGARRNFTLRWTFTQVGGAWLADLAEAYPTR